jgi:hypothetical protein
VPSGGHVVFQDFLCVPTFGGLAILILNAAVEFSINLAAALVNVLGLA